MCLTYSYHNNIDTREKKSIERISSFQVKSHKICHQTKKLISHEEIKMPNRNEMIAEKVQNQYSLFVMAIF